MKRHMSTSEKIMCPKCRKITYHRRHERVVFDCDNCGYSGFGSEGTAMSEGDRIRSMSDIELADFLAHHDFKRISPCPEDWETQKCLEYLLNESSEIRSCLDIHYGKDS